MKKILGALVLAAMSNQVGCAAILAPKTITLPVTSDPQQADVFVDGIRVGKTPMRVQLDPKRSHVIKFHLDGRQDISYPVNSSVGAGWVVADVFLSGVVGIVIDAATGSWNQLDSDHAAVRFAAPMPVARPAGMPATKPSVDACRLEGSPMWQRASAKDKRRMLDECRAQLKAPPST